MAVRTRFSHGLAAFGALLGLATLALQFWLLLSQIEASGGGPALAAWRFLGYFTILTNVLAAASGLDLAE